MGKLPESKLNEPFYKKWLLTAANQRSYFHVIMANLKVDLEKSLPETVCPVLLIYGDKDRVTTIETGLGIYRAIGFERENVELTAFENCGHFPHIQYPKRTAIRIAKFAESHVALKPG